MRARAFAGGWTDRLGFDAHGLVVEEKACAVAVAAGAHVAGMLEAMIVSSADLAYRLVELEDAGLPVEDGVEGSIEAVEPTVVDDEAPQAYREQLGSYAWVEYAYRHTHFDFEELG